MLKLFSTSRLSFKKLVLFGWSGILLFMCWDALEIMRILLLKKRTVFFCHDRMTGWCTDVINSDAKIILMMLFDFNWQIEERRLTYMTTAYRLTIFILFSMIAELKWETRLRVYFSSQYSQLVHTLNKKNSTSDMRHYEPNRIISKIIILSAVAAISFAHFPFYHLLHLSKKGVLSVQQCVLNWIFRLQYWLYTQVLKPKCKKTF